MKVTKKDLFTIPNILGYFRIILVPIFCYYIIYAESMKDIYIATGLIILSGLSDLFDGKIARKLNQVTELGKILDPIADKLTLVALLLCLSINNNLLIPVLVLTLIKELFMGVVGLAMLKHNGRKLDGAMMCGKICTFVLYVVLGIFLLFPKVPHSIAIALVIIATAVVIYALVMYSIEFHKMWKLPTKTKADK